MFATLAVAISLLTAQQGPPQQAIAVARAAASNEQIKATVQARRDRQRRRNIRTSIRDARAEEFARRQEIAAQAQLKQQLEIARVQAELGKAEGLNRIGAGLQAQAQAAQMETARRAMQPGYPAYGQTWNCPTCGRPVRPPINTIQCPQCILAERQRNAR
jgi:rubrerythrin